MTVIAWDGENLATDSMVSSGYNKYLRSPKLFFKSQYPTKFNPDGIRAILAGSGNLQDIGRLISWWKRGGWSQEFRTDKEITDADIFPYPFSSVKNSFSQLIVVENNRIIEYNNSSVHNEFKLNLEGSYAWGSGSEVALAALRSGKNAIDAVKVAIEICHGCGGGVQYCNINKHEIKYLQESIEYSQVDQMKFDIKF